MIGQCTGGSENGHGQAPVLVVLVRVLGGRLLALRRLAARRGCLRIVRPKMMMHKLEVPVSSRSLSLLLQVRLADLEHDAAAGVSEQR